MVLEVGEEGGVLERACAEALVGACRDSVGEGRVGVAFDVETTAGHVAVKLWRVQRRLQPGDLEYLRAEVAALQFVICSFSFYSLKLRNAAHTDVFVCFSPSQGMHVGQHGAAHRVLRPRTIRVPRDRVLCARHTRSLCSTQPRTLPRPRPPLHPRARFVVF